jgi:hypothetical protein
LTYKESELDLCPVKNAIIYVFDGLGWLSYF